MKDRASESIVRSPDRDRFLKWARQLERQRPSVVASIVAQAYRYQSLRRVCLALIRRLERSHLQSPTLRALLKRYHGVVVGCYTYGACLQPGCLPEGGYIGNYCSVADGLRIYRRNHPVDHLSQHPYFYNRHLGLVVKDTIIDDSENPLVIGHDVWIGAGTTILPGCQKIGNGAVVGAGSVVTRDVEPYAMVVGNPARMVRKRFAPDIQELVERSRWWELPPSRLILAGDLLFGPITKAGLEAFVARIEADRT